MTSLFVRHTVSDYATWRKAYDGFAAFQKANGVLAQAVYQSTDNPNDVTVTHDFASLDAAKNFIGRPELKAAMQSGGVTGAPHHLVRQQGLKAAPGVAAVPTETFAAGGYRFIPGVFQYSAGVAALPGFEIVRVRFRTPPNLADGFARIAAHLKAVGRPATAFCACELRSPAPFSEPGFRAFNEAYVSQLRALGILGDELNPVARTNVCPEIAPPAEPGFHAFCYTRPKTAAPSANAATLVVSGSGEVPEGQSNYRDHIVRPGDVTPEGLREKARYVLAAMESRLAALDAGWADTTAAQVYTIHDIHPFLAAELVQRGAAAYGVTWHYTRPPVAGLDYEMDCRGIAGETVV